MCAAGRGCLPSFIGDPVKASGRGCLVWGCVGVGCVGVCGVYICKRIYTEKYFI